jgi:hypothetical protein
MRYSRHCSFVLLALFTMLWACSEDSVRSVPVPEIRALSSRPDSVSGGDVLVQVSGPSRSKWSAFLNGKDVSSSFRFAEVSGGSLALLAGLRDGANLLELRVGRTVRADLTVINHAAAGPIFSGPHQQPFLCQTQANELSAPRDKDCSADTLIQYYYKTSSSLVRSNVQSRPSSFERLAQGLPPGFPEGFKPYDLRDPPSDVADTVTSDGRSIPYIVRREVGVINRSIYDIRFLHQPGQPLPSPWVGSPAWNGRLVYVFFGGCAAGFRQGVLYREATDEVLLAEGYAVVMSTLNTFGVNCNPVLSAETASMIKEHFIKEYGPPIHTIGWGTSGGAMQLYSIAQSYPGILDGIVPFSSFPDVVSYSVSGTDCKLLVGAFRRTRLRWTDKQKTAVSGFPQWAACENFAVYGGGTDSIQCPKQIPSTEIYDAVARPHGIHCDLFSNAINILGIDERTGNVRRPIDNVGVQYGLTAFNSGMIDAEQFVELNESIGGLDLNGSFSDARMQGNTDGVERSYESGLALTGGGGLAVTPIIDWRQYSDDVGGGDIHTSFRSFSMRARLAKVNGGSANQVIVIDPPSTASGVVEFDDPDPHTSVLARREYDLVRLMDRWIDQIEADHGSGGLAQKVVRDRPEGLTDECRTAASGSPSGSRVFDADGACARVYPTFGDPRIAAGGPITDDVLKCALKPLGHGDYGRAFTDAQWMRMLKAFPQGVCDYGRPGIGQQPSRPT